MKISIDVDGKTYVPVAAVPYVTGGFFTVRDVILMIVQPDAFYDPAYNAILHAFEFLPFERLAYVGREQLSAIADTCIVEQREPPLARIARIVVPVTDLRALMKVVSERESHGKVRTLPKRPSATWDIEAPMPLSVGLAIFKNLPVVLNFTDTRINSAKTMADRIGDAIERISRDAAQNRISFDRTNLPGRKTDFVRILQKVDRRIARAPSTLEGYLSEAGLRWRQGSKPDDAAPLLALYGLSID